MNSVTISHMYTYMYYPWDENDSYQIFGVIRSEVKCIKRWCIGKSWHDLVCFSFTQNHDNEIWTSQCMKMNPYWFCVILWIRQTGMRWYLSKLCPQHLLFVSVLFWIEKFHQDAVFKPMLFFFFLYLHVNRNFTSMGFWSSSFLCVFFYM
jgi:hypothetical protein